MKPRNMNQATVNSKQAGVTLLLSVLILSGIMLISITVGFFAIAELRSSRSVVLSEPAISAAESAAEQGLWKLKRSISTIASCPALDTSNLANNASSDTCKSYGAATLEIKGGTPFQFFLYNPDDINGDTELDGSAIDPDGFPITNIQFTELSGAFSVGVVVARIDGDGIAGGSFSVNSDPVTFFVPAVPSGEEGRMIVTLNSVDDATIIVNTNQGMPDFPTINASGCAGGIGVSDCDSLAETFKRRINVVVPQ